MQERATPDDKCFSFFPLSGCNISYFVLVFGSFFFSSSFLIETNGESMSAQDKRDNKTGPSVTVQAPWLASHWRRNSAQDRELRWATEDILASGEIQKPQIRGRGSASSGRRTKANSGTSGHPARKLSPARDGGGRDLQRAKHETSAPNFLFPTAGEGGSAQITSTITGGPVPARSVVG